MKGSAPVYANASVALLTLHEKERVIAPAFQRLGAVIVVTRDLDTDALGTFTGEITREGTQIDAARRKARSAVQLTGLRLGIGSEGTLRSGPFGLVTTTLEVVHFLDTVQGIEVTGRCHAKLLYVQRHVSHLAELEQAAKEAGFPEHGLVISSEAGHPLRKGLRSWSELVAAFDEARSEASAAVVRLENDVRAHQHPGRMRIIERAANDLVDRLSCECSACGAPGFGATRLLKGRLCRDCGAETDLARAEEHSCPRCSMTAVVQLAEEGADAFYCPVCNP